MEQAGDFNTGIRGYVLAGGGSTRFGRDKALVEFGGTPLLLQIVKLAQACASPVTIIANAEKYRHLDASFEIVEDRWPGEGPLGGIITALQHTAGNDRYCRWNLILSCDMPFLTANGSNFSLTARSPPVPRRKSSSRTPLTVRSHCAPAIAPTAADALKNVFDSGIRKVTAALKQLPTEVLDESVWKRFDSAGRLFWNMNTPDDFAEAQRIWGEEQL